ncbi:MAG: hypothetical protein IJ748_04300 [Bacteroidales bacterium]|nr:hypothetical protein [Bacteroidales bacterium]
MKKRGLLYIGIILGTVLIIILTNIMMRNSYIKSVEVNIIYPTKDRIILKQEIENDLTKHFGVFTKQKRKQIEVNTVKLYLEDKNFVEQASVSISITGVLKISVTQRSAIARVYNRRNETFYIDKNMCILKSENGKAADVVVVSGNITDTVKSTIDSVKNKQMFEIFTLATLINNDSILKYQIDQIVRKDTDYILIPKIGEYDIALGGKTDWEDELIRLHYLYKKAFIKNGWEKYSHIDLRFKNQVVCTRK